MTNTKEDLKNKKHFDGCGPSSNNTAHNTQKQTRRIVHTKFVHTKKDSALKDRYSSDFNDVYYALKKQSRRNGSGVTGTELFIELNRRIKRKVIFEILDGASWSKKLSSNRYVFYDKEYEERKKRQMDEELKRAENEFFTWLPTFLPPHALEEVKNTYRTISALLVQKKVLPQFVAATTQIGQIEDALKQVNGVFGGKKLRSQATKLLTAYLAFLREKKNTKPTYELSQAVEIQKDWIRFDFTNAQSFERTYPVYCSVNSTVVTGKNWARILIAIVENELARQNPALDELYKEPLYPNRANRPFFLKKSIVGLNCADISNGYFVNINYSIPRLMEIIQAFCLHCGYNKKQVVLYGVPKRTEGEKTVYKKTSDMGTNSIKESNLISPIIRERILSCVSTAFPNGIRPTSIIDINKLKRIYEANYDEEIPPELDIISLLTSVGLKNGEKLYFLTDDQKRSMYNLIVGIITEGHRVIYYSELLSLHSELFEACHLYESLLIKNVFRSIMSAFIYKSDYMLVDQSANETEEITRAFGENVLMTYQQIKKRCPYLTLNAIKWTLSRSDRFVWSSPDTYAQTDLIELDQAEISDIINRIIPLIQVEGYYSLAQLPLEESCGMNPQVSSSAVRDAIYNRYMSDRFTRNGLIVKRPEISLSTYQLIEAWLKGLDKVTVAEISAYERELTGHHALLGIAAACKTMVRIDRDHFVSDASIQFDVDAVDYAISLFAGNRIIPITAITSFTSFPGVSGYAWNLFLVESFLRRFSKRFTIEGGPARMSYVGGICSADWSFENYEDCLAHAVIQDGVALTEEAVGRYLTERKFILRRGETVRKTLERALILDEQRGDINVRI